MKDTLLESIFGEKLDSLSDDTQKAISEAFEQKVTLALEAQEKEYTSKIQELIDMKDSRVREEQKRTLDEVEQYTISQLDEVASKLEETYSAKLANAESIFTKTIEEDINKKTKTLLEAVEVFIDSFIEDAIPQKTIEEVARNNRANRLVEELTQTLGAHNADDRIKNQLKESIKLREEAELKLQTYEKAKVLQEVTDSLPREKAIYIMEAFKDAKHSAEDVKKNFNYLSTLYDKKEQKSIVSERKVYSKTPLSKPVDQTPQILNEQNTSGVGENTAVSPMMSEWITNAHNQSTHEIDWSQY